MSPLGFSSVVNDQVIISNKKWIFVYMNICTFVYMNICTYLSFIDDLEVNHYLQLYKEWNSCFQTLDCFIICWSYWFSHRLISCLDCLQWATMHTLILSCVFTKYLNTLKFSHLSVQMKQVQLQWTPGI